MADGVSDPSIPEVELVLKAKLTEVKRRMPPANFQLLFEGGSDPGSTVRLIPTL